MPGANGSKVKGATAKAGQVAAISVDLDDLTIEDMEAIEDATGKDISELSRARLMHGFAFVLARRQDPSFTWEQASKIRLNSLMEGGPLGVQPAAGTASSG